MKAKSRGWIGKAGALAAVFLIILTGSGPAFGKVRDHGKEITVKKKDGTIMKGELIAVRGNSLLLKSTTSSENSVDIGDVNVVTIIKKPQFLSGLGLGLAVGVGFGAVIGLTSGDDRPGFMSWTAEQKAGMLGIALGVVGGVVGGISGVLAGVADDKITIKEPADPNKITKLLDKLRSLSQFPDEK